MLDPGNRFRSVTAQLLDKLIDTKLALPRLAANLHEFFHLRSRRVGPDQFFKEKCFIG